MSKTMIQQPMEQKKGFGYQKLQQKEVTTQGFTTRSYQKNVQVGDRKSVV